MKQIQNRDNGSRYISPLSPACKMCEEGAKMVLLITGLCPSNCFYCPLSREKLNTDRIFADEWELEDEKDTEKLFLEAKYIDSKGAGITGGDPLVVWDRTKKYIEFLKDNFGPGYHIHLYTSGIKNYEHIGELASAGLDEIRFHPSYQSWGKMEKSPIKKAIRKALETEIDVAIEIPAIPHMQKQIIDLISWSNKHEINWINLNELEFSETNAELLSHKKYDVKNEISSAVKNSEETAYEIIEECSLKDLDVGLHYCSSSFKDGIQLRNRIRRRAKNISKKHEIITEDGTILKGIINPNINYTVNRISQLLRDKYNLNKKDIYLNREKNRVEISVEKIEKLSSYLKKLNLEIFIIEEYPTADQLEVERIPLLG